MPLFERREGIGIWPVDTVDMYDRHHWRSFRKTKIGGSFPRCRRRTDKLILVLTDANQSNESSCCAHDRRCPPTANTSFRAKQSKAQSKAIQSNPIPGGIFRGWPGPWTLDPGPPPPLPFIIPVASGADRFFSTPPRAKEGNGVTTHQHGASGGRLCHGQQ